MPSAEELFRAHFWPLYPPDAQADLAKARAVDANPAKNPSIERHLDEAANVFVHQARALFDADLGLDFTDASVHRLSAALTRARRDAWASRENELFNVVVHGAAYVGACIVRCHGGAWSARRPLWESVVHLKSRAGEGDLAVFHWWLKSLADDAFEGGATLADRYRALVENACARPEDLPRIAPPDRRLPRLLKPSYHLLNKHLKAHLPELRDLGEDFPSAERFAELSLASLDFALVGDGRMLVLAGIASNGLHLFFLTSSGFEKAAFYPSDSFPAPIFSVADGKLRVVRSVDKQMMTDETLWWGP